MAQSNAENGADHRVNPVDLVVQACETDDVSLMEQAISLVSRPESRRKVDYILERGIRRAVGTQAVRVLQCVLDHGADVGSVTSTTFDTIHHMPSLAVLEILLAHGWDINTRGPGGNVTPLLWEVLKDHDLVKWFLDHGASPDPPGPERPHGPAELPRGPPPTMLGYVAAHGSVETFELLRENNAPMNARLLHDAVEQATLLSPNEGSPGLDLRFRSAMDMVRHLTDTVKLDVNTVAYMPGSQASTPLCFPASRANSQDFQELVCFLLDRGADPNLGDSEWLSPIAVAESSHNERFLHIVREWQARYKSGDNAE